MTGSGVEKYDLVISGGRIIDVAAEIDVVGDVAISQGRVVAIGTFPSEDAREVIDATGCLVVPGLIDLHAHVFWGINRGVDADTACLPQGVTTVVDAGGAGSMNFPGFKRYIVDPARTRVLAFVHLSAVGMVSAAYSGELRTREMLDPQGAVDLIKAHPDVVRGVKTRLEERAVGSHGLEFLKLAREVGAAAHAPMMVHICGATDPLDVFLPHFAPGDIVTHMMTSRGRAQLLENGRITDEVRAARQRGVLFDVAHGRNHFSFDVADRLFGEGFFPDAISTDLSELSIDGPVYGLPQMMSKHLQLGMELIDVIRATTQGPAAALGMSDSLGSIAVGREADVTVLELVDVEGTMTDTEGASRPLTAEFVVRAVVRAGVAQDVGRPADTVAERAAR